MKEHKINIIILSILSFLSVTIFCYFHFIGDDIFFHVDNITNVVTNLKYVIQGKYYIMPNIGNNLGYGLYIFYPILPHFFYSVIAKLFGLIGVSVTNSVIFTSGLVSILSTLSFYLLSFKFYKDKKIAFLASLFFVFFPYRIVDLLSRCAINESFCFIFIPMILTSLIYLEEKNKKLFYFFFCFGYIGLILSHLVISLYFSIILMIYVILNFKKYFNRNIILDFIKAILFVSIIVLPNIIMMLEHRHMGYIIFDTNIMNNTNILNGARLSFVDFLFPFKSKFINVIVYISLSYVICFIISTYYIFKQKKSDYIKIFLMIILILLSVSTIINWKQVPSIFTNIQFPWRMEIFLCVLMCLYIPYFLTIKSNSKYKIIVIILIFLSGIRFYVHLSYKETFDWYDVTYEYGAGYNLEYNPVESLFYKNDYAMKKDIDVIYGKADIHVKSKYPDLIFEVSNIKGETAIELPRIYYKGYELEKNNDKMIFGRSEKGLIRSYIYSDGIYTLTYKGTAAHQILRLIRFLFIIVCIYFVVLKKLGIWKGSKYETLKKNKV